MAVLAVLMVVFIIGTFVGSFLNVCIHRLPRNESIVSPGSKCYSCGTHVAWYDNIPVVSYLILRGRCRWCDAHFSIRYLVIEALVGLLCVGVVVGMGMYSTHWVSPFLGSLLSPSDHVPSRALLLILSAVAVGAMLSLVFYLVVATLTDLAYLIIPDELTKSFQLLAPVLAILCGTNLQYYGLDLQRSTDNDPINLLPVSYRWMMPGQSQVAHGWSLIGHELVITFVGTLLLVLSLPLAQYIYSTRVPPAQRWKEGDYRSFAIGVAWFTGCLTLITLGVVICGFLSVHQPQNQWVVWLGVQLSQAALGALTGFGSLYAVGLLGTLVFGRSAMGFGDVKFLAPIGCFLGPLGVVLAFFLAAMIGSVVGLPMRLLRSQRELPFGPYLALGSLVVLACGPQLVSHLNDFLVHR